MNLTNQHKALIISSIFATIVLTLAFNLGLERHEMLLNESYYELEPEKKRTPEEEKIQKTLDKFSKARTNSASNENKKNKHFAQAFKTIAPPKDYVPKFSSYQDGPNTAKQSYKKQNDTELNKEELETFSKVNELLKKQKSGNDNSKSTISYSLLNRTKVHIPIPIYLCEENGKIVVNITVNDKGNVVNTYVNSSSNSANECLKERALEYAKQSVFSPDPSKPSQIGTITFNFIGK
ncbi:energy transducer TonB [Tamlana sp. 62-3]|uniref:Energy transducer TonB n=1 Tax=Neotamlana sargassicola TaxID=2883125 RepID=A0A9X1L5P0_9FLAO|nr:energy transducer TonB [Tamlana sargassicola]MCB4806916.1 energy transducer TonB [Tamlana sargassicola]